MQPVAESVWALVGEKEQRFATDFTSNATFGVVATKAAVVLIEPGGSWQGAKEIHAATKGLTDQPVAVVVNTGGQDHRWLGNAYWLAQGTQGAQVITSDAAVQDHNARADTLAYLMNLRAVVGALISALTYCTVIS